MELYIGNATKQHQMFCYQVVDEVRGTSSLRQQRIPIGSQVKITGDLNTPQIDAIVKQHERYGMMSVEEALKRSPRHVVGMVYSVDRPIAIPKLLTLVETNTQVLREVGKKNREAAAVGASDVIERALQANTDLNASLGILDVSTVEHEPAGGYQHDAPVGEGVLVDRTAPEGGGSSPRREPGNRRSRGR